MIANLLTRPNDNADLDIPFGNPLIFAGFLIAVFVVSYVAIAHWDARKRRDR